MQFQTYFFNYNRKITYYSVAENYDKASINT